MGRSRGALTRRQSGTCPCPLAPGSLSPRPCGCPQMLKQVEQWQHKSRAHQRENNNKQACSYCGALQEFRVKRERPCVNEDQQMPNQETGNPLPPPPPWDKILNWRRGIPTAIPRIRINRVFHKINGYEMDTCSRRRVKEVGPLVPP